MKKGIQFIVLFYFLSMLFSCGSSKKVKFNCSSEIIPQKKVDEMYVGYSISIPSDWYSYEGVHCFLTHSPKEYFLTRKKPNFKWVRVNMYHSKDKFFYNEFKNVDEFMNSSLEGLRKRFKKPKFQISKMNHKIYGEYRVLKYGYKFFGHDFMVASVFFFYKGLGYVVNYDVNLTDFEKYLPEFGSVVESFTIKE